LFRQVTPGWGVSVWDGKGRKVGVCVGVALSRGVVFAVALAVALVVGVV
jgi:hypothetical protein